MAFPWEAFTAFISNAPMASTPGSSDMLALIQGGLTKRVPITQLPGLQPIVTVPTIVVTASTYNALITDYTIAVNRSPAGATIINLPGSAGFGRPMIIKDIAGNCDNNNTITVTNGTIDGLSSFVLDIPYGCVVLQSMGSSNWSVISQVPDSETTIITNNATPTYDMVVLDKFIGIRKTPGSITTVVLLNAPPKGTEVTIKDCNGDAAVHNITIANGSIDGSAGKILNTAYAAITLRSLGTGNDWAIVSTH